MADRRMFASQIVESDAFTDMPISAQALYFHMGMNADDDGFINNAKKVIAIIGASTGDLSILIDKRFILAFPSGVYVIKHWRMANTIQKDRYHPTAYEDEMSSLVIKENKAYTEKESLTNKVSESSETSLSKACFQGSGKPVSKVSESSETQLDKLDQLDKLEEINMEATKNTRKRFIPPTLDEVREYCESRNSSVDPVKFFDYYSAGNWKDSKGDSVKNWKQKVITWERKEEKNAGSGNSGKSVSSEIHADNQRGTTAGRFAGFKYDI